MNYTTVVGLEVHVQLQTNTKLFCSCLNRFNPDHPNTQTCPVCLGLPGALPVLNRKAMDLALKIGVALNCEISSFTKWDRKQYYYPDLPKAYQISQYDLPFSSQGFLEVDVPDDKQGARRIRINRAHLEEDAGKNLHDESGRGGDSKVDLNRCGTPLVEIVSEPDIRSAAEARKYLEELKLLLSYLKVSDCNMQEGSLRCDANVNLHITTDEGHPIATPIVEIKNLNSFRNVELAIDYEAKRQFKVWEQTGQKLGDPGVTKETHGWDANRGVTTAQRGKEDAADYRYFPDPDLVPVTVGEDTLQTVREQLIELPAARRTRIEEEYKLSAYDASVIIEQGEQFSNYFEETARGCGSGKQAANWMTQDILRELNERNWTLTEFPVSSVILADLLARVEQEQISVKSARDIFKSLLKLAAAGSELSTETIELTIKENGLEMVTDTSALEEVLDAVIARNTKAAEDVRNGKQAAAGPLIGQVMRELQGADAKMVRQMLLEKLSS